MLEDLKLSKGLGKKIKKFRKHAKLTQEDLADKLDISRAYMGHVEQGRNVPSIELLNKISKYLKVSIKDLF